MITYNPLLCLDFYKTCHAEQYPNGLTKMVSYYTPRMSRLGDTDKVTLFGLQAFIQEYLIEAFNDHFFNVPLIVYSRSTPEFLGQQSERKALERNGFVNCMTSAIFRYRFVLFPKEREPISKFRKLKSQIHTLTSYGWSTPSRRCFLAQCGIRKSPLRLGTDIVKSSMSMQNALAMTMWFVRDSLAIFLCAGKRALKVQQRAQRLSA